MPDLDVGGIRIHYRRFGTGSPVVLVSGFLAGGNIWEMVVERVQESGSCLVLDNRGVGLSSAAPGEYTISMLAGDLDGLLDRLGISRPLVVGHSMGGFIAIELALTGRCRPAGLVLVSTASSGRSENPGMTRRGREAIFRARGSRDQIIDGVLSVGLGTRIHEQAPERIEHFKRLLHDATPTRAGYIGQRSAVETFDADHRLGNITCPCKVVHGAEDKILPHASGERLAEAISNAELTLLPGVGHFPQIEAPRALSAIIREAAT